MADETGRNRTAKRELALAALLEGATVTQAAERSGVRRQTVSGWVNHDSGFIAELRNRRSELWRSQRAGLEAKATRALERLGELVDHEDPKIALAAVRVTLDRLGDLPVPERLVTSVDVATER
ncbi:hypothetical protein OAX78_04525, partial [Planctomycetota bacterium]|nr:hypothetical protein [Planctomycetota bacterium]